MEFLATDDNYSLLSVPYSRSSFSLVPDQTNAKPLHKRWSSFATDDNYSVCLTPGATCQMLVHVREGISPPAIDPILLYLSSGRNERLNTEKGANSK
jgi:hypothetical protein